MSVVVRKAVESDCQGILDLITELAVYEKMEDQVKMKVESEGRYFYSNLRYEKGNREFSRTFDIRHTVTGYLFALREDGFGDEKYFQCFVAENQENGSSKLIGYVLYYYIYSTWEGKCIYMEDLYVSPEYRGRGIGSKLMGSVCKTAVEKKCARVHFAVLGWNTPSIDYYKRQGAIDLTEEEDWHLFRLTGSAIEKMAAKCDI